MCRRSCIFSLRFCHALCSSEDSGATCVIVRGDVNLRQTTKHRWPFRAESEMTLVAECKCEQWLIQFERVATDGEYLWACRISLIHVQVHASGASSPEIPVSYKMKCCMKNAINVLFTQYELYIKAAVTLNKYDTKLTDFVSCCAAIFCVWDLLKGVHPILCVFNQGKCQQVCLIMGLGSVKM